MVEIPIKARIVADWSEFVESLKRIAGRSINVRVGAEGDGVAGAPAQPPQTGGLVSAILDFKQKIEENFGRRGGIFQAFARFLGARAPILLALFALIELTKTMVGAVMDLARSGAEYSGYMRATLRLLDIMFKLALKPIADVVGFLLKPVLLALLKYVIIPWSKTTQNLEEVAKFVKEKVPPWEEIWAGIPIPEFGRITERELVYAAAIRGAGMDAALRRIINEWYEEGRDKAGEYGSGLEKVAEEWSYTGAIKAVEFDGALRRVVNEFRERGNENVIAFGNVFRQAVEGFANVVSNALQYASRKLGEISSSIAIAASQAAERIKDIVSGAYVKSEDYYLREAVAKVYNVDIAAVYGFDWFQIGGLVRKTGIYMLHAGEVVVPSWRVGDIGGRTVNNVFNVTVNVNVDSISSELDIRRVADTLAQEIIREIERRGRI